MIGQRIKQARRMRGMSLRDLASRADVSAQAISKYERGINTPSSPVLLRVAKALDLKVEFFLRPPRVGDIMPRFRKRSRLPRKQEAALRERMRDWVERYLEAEQLRNPEGIGFVYPEGFPREVCTLLDTEEIAEALRRAWDVGLAPIANLTELLEEKGIKVGSVEAPIGFDACTFSAEDGRIQVIVTRDDLPGDRQRFSLAHELGHLLLRPKRGLDPEKVMHRFAGAFLAPASVVRTELGDRRDRLTSYELHELKHKYGLSMQVWILRARDLCVLRKVRVDAYLKIFRKRGWHRREPGDAYPEEHPTRFARLVMQSLEEDIIAEGRATELLGRPVKDFLAEISKDHHGLPTTLRD